MSQVINFFEVANKAIILLFQKFLESLAGGLEETVWWFSQSRIGLGQFFLK